jgi:hypothetical protein
MTHAMRGRDATRSPRSESQLQRRRPVTRIDIANLHAACLRIDTGPQPRKIAIARQRAAHDATAEVEGEA